MTRDVPPGVAESDLQLGLDSETFSSQGRLIQPYRWRALADAYLVRRDRHPDRLLVCYEGRPAVRSELTELILVEEQAFPLLTWIMVDTDEGVTLLIHGSSQILNWLEPVLCNKHVDLTQT